MRAPSSLRLIEVKANKERIDISVRQPKRNPYHVLLQHVLNDLQNEPSAWPFVKPVDSSVVADYYDVIKDPMGGCNISLFVHLVMKRLTPFMQTCPPWNPN